jgi:hypothetical protein
MELKEGVYVQGDNAVGVLDVSGRTYFVPLNLENLSLGKGDVVKVDCRLDDVEPDSFVLHGFFNPGEVCYMGDSDFVRTALANYTLERKNR